MELHQVRHPPPRPLKALCAQPLRLGGEGSQSRRPTCRQVFPQSEVMYISSLFSTSWEPRLPGPEGKGWDHTRISLLPGPRSEPDKSPDRGRWAWLTPPTSKAPHRCAPPAFTC